jgi:hypothetical protein
MALFNKTGNKANRASSILSKLNVEEEQKEEKQEEQEQKEEKQEEQKEEKQEEKQEESQEHKQEKQNQEEQEEHKQEIKQEEKKEEDKPVNTDKPELTDEVVFSYLSELLKREVKSADDLTQKEREMDPEVKQLLDWKEETGLSLSKWSDYTKDYSALGDLEVAKEILVQKNPSFTKEEIEFKLKSYIYDEDYDDENDQIKKSIALKEFASQGREELNKNKLNLKESTVNPALTQEQAELIDFAKNVRKDVEASTTNQTNYVNKMNESATDFEGLNLKLSDDIEIKYDIPEGDKKGLVKEILEMPQWYNEDGTMKHDVVLSDGLKVTHFDSIMKMVFQQGIDAEKEGKITGTKPGDGVPPIPQKGGGPKKSNIDDIVSNITGGKTKLRFGRKK